MLVNTHKLLPFSLLFVFFSRTVKAQEWSLQQCLDTAQIHNRTIQIASNSKEVAAEKYKETIANLVPKININADYKYYFDLPTQLMPMPTFSAAAADWQFKEAQFGVAHNIGANIQLSIPVYNPQLIGSVKTTAIAKELVQLQYQKNVELVYTEVCNLYYNAQILNKQLTFIDSNISNTEKLLSTITLLREQQLARGTDVGKVELQLSQLQIQKTTVANKLEQVLAALKFTMGLELDMPFAVSLTISTIEASYYSNTNPIDISIANVQQHLAFAEINNVKRTLLPSLSLVASYGKQGFGYDKKPHDFLKFYPVNFVGMQFSYPLFAGAVTCHKIKQKKLELQNCELQTRIAFEQNKMQVRNTSMQRDLARKNIHSTQMQILQSQAVYNLTMLQQTQGMANITEVLLADNSVREAQQLYLSAIVDYLKADIELKRLTGNISTTK